MKHSYQQDISSIVQQLQTDSIRGLSANQVSEQRAKFGFNTLPEKPQPSLLSIFLWQFASPLIYILLIAAFLIFFISDTPFDAFIIGAIVLFNAIIGTIQESRTQKIVKSLITFFVQECIVIRDGQKIVVLNNQLVPGDIIIVQSGQRVPADAQIIESYNLKVDEALLTGESLPADKDNKTIVNDVPIGDRKNMLYSGTWVLMGWAKAVVIATGTATEIGKISSTAQEIQTDIPLAKEMRRLSWWILVFVIGICLSLFSIGILFGQSLQELLITLTALFVCVIPEGLPVVLTLVLVTGVYRMAKSQVLVKNMQAVEGLGHINAIVIDKTGTLTRNEMVVSKVFADNQILSITGKGYYPEGKILYDGKPVTINQNSTVYTLAQALYLLNTTTITLISKKGTFTIKGDPTEAALFVFAQKVGIEINSEHFKKIYEIPFGALQKYRAVFFEHNNQCIVYIAGAPEIIFERAELPKQVPIALDSFLQDGLRVIAVAMKTFNCADIPDSNQDTYFVQIIATDLIFLGLCGIEDSIRVEALETIKNTRNAGIKVIMATGDHMKTALAVAKQVDIYNQNDEAIDGGQLDKYSDQDLSEVILQTTVFARMSPEQKIRIIKALHAHNLTVAMTGDGVNDVPSLVAADIGISMGTTGTEASKQVADIILLDDSFINILHAIEEGRHIIYTLRRVIVYFFSTNLAEILLIFFVFVIFIASSSANIILPLTAAQILWLNVITDGFLDTALAMEKKEKGLLLHKPQSATHINLIDTTMVRKIVFMAIPMAIGSLLVFMLYRPVDLIVARAMTLATLCMFQWFNAWNCRSDTKSIFQLGIFSNGWLIIATILVIALQLLIMYVPFFQTVFNTTSLNGYQWLFAIVISSSILWLEEIRKLFIRRFAE